ncbi:hypothetical protein [Phytohabitans flavus]|uniref:hypothetical protein n=1 Tax=Phytohabitans flavus TaxID=1076124 RepID=UPI0031F10D11
MTRERFVALATGRTMALAGDTFDYTLIERSIFVPTNRTHRYYVTDAAGATVAWLGPSNPVEPVEKPWYRYLLFGGMFAPDGQLLRQYEHGAQGRTAILDAEIKPRSWLVLFKFKLTISVGQQVIGGLDAQKFRPYDPIAVVATDGRLIATIQRLQFDRDRLYASRGARTRITLTENACAWPPHALLMLVPALDHVCEFHSNS